MPPTCTRRQAVTVFDSSFCLYIVTQGDLFPQEQCYFNSIAVQAVGEREIEHDDRTMALQTLRVTFWSVESSLLPVFEAIVVAPLDWTPRMYLAALSLTIRRRNGVCCNVDGINQRLSRLNEVHWLFNDSLENAISVLRDNHAFLFIDGGTKS